MFQKIRMVCVTDNLRPLAHTIFGFYILFYHKRTCYTEKSFLTSLLYVYHKRCLVDISLPSEQHWMYVIKRKSIKSPSLIPAFYFGEWVMLFLILKRPSILVALCLLTSEQNSFICSSSLAAHPFLTKEVTIPYDIHYFQFSLVV